MSKKPILRCALLLLAAAAPCFPLSLSVLPAHPVEGSPFTLVIGLVGSCPVPDSVIATPGHPGIVTVTLRDLCLSPGQPTVVEVPIGPLADGPWILRVGPEALLVEVEALPFAIDFDPPYPLDGSPFTLRLTGSGNCPSLGPAKQDGNLLTLRYIGDCPILPPPPSPFVIEQRFDPLLAGDYVVQVIDPNGSTIASRRLHVFSGFECIPSETALCLLQGRFHIKATWRTAKAQGVAHARPETADSGSFWFFGPDNLELLVKVLDACQTSAPAVWVFAAGLTDVEVEITVTDLASPQAKGYHNPLGKAFTPIQDTRAFSCSPSFPGS